MSVTDFVNQIAGKSDSEKQTAKDLASAITDATAGQTFAADLTGQRMPGDRKASKFVQRILD